MNTKSLRIAIVVAAFVAVSQSGPSGQSNADKLHFTAFAVNMSNVATGATQLIEIDVNSWSLESERAALVKIATAKEGNQDALLAALQKQPKRGRMWAPQWQGPDPFNARLGWDIRYSYQEPTAEGGRKVVLATDRFIPFWEARNRPRTIDYPFTLIQIEVDRDGRGEGKMSVATKITFDENKKVLELENYTTEPVRLNNVKMTVKK
jgi:hypothetical protein